MVIDIVRTEINDLNAESDKDKRQHQTSPKGRLPLQLTRFSNLLTLDSAFTASA